MPSGGRGCRSEFVLDIDHHNSPQSRSKRHGWGKSVLHPGAIEMKTYRFIVIFAAFAVLAVAIATPSSTLADQSRFVVANANQELLLDSPQLTAGEFDTRTFGCGVRAYDSTTQVTLGFATLSTAANGPNTNLGNLCTLAPNTPRRICNVRIL